jgi:hypothetical protein
MRKVSKVRYKVPFLLCDSTFAFTARSLSLNEVCTYGLRYLRNIIPKNKMSNRNAITLEMENLKKIGTFHDDRKTEQTVDVRSKGDGFSGEATPAVNFSQRK